MIHVENPEIFHFHITSIFSESVFDILPMHKYTKMVEPTGQ